MTRRLIRSSKMSASFVFLLLLGVGAAPARKLPLRLQGKGSVLLSTDAPSRFVMSGIATQLGRYNTIGELEFVPGPTAGSLIGSGVVVFIARNGDQLVGVMNWQTNENGGGKMSFSWRDFIQFTDGTIVSNTGRFVRNRPAGTSSDIQLMHEDPHQSHPAPVTRHTIGIIAILIG
jgi:hypothetical protein